MRKNYVEEQRQKVDELRDRMQHGRESGSPFIGSRREFHWVFGFTSSGKKVTLGPFSHAGEADAKASRLDSAEVFELPTRDRGRAVQMIRAILLKRGEAVDKSLEKHLSERGLRREQRRYSPFRKG